MYSVMHICYCYYSSDYEHIYRVFLMQIRIIIFDKDYRYGLKQLLV